MSTPQEPAEILYTMTERNGEIIYTPTWSREWHVKPAAEVEAAAERLWDLFQEALA